MKELKQNKILRYLVFTFAVAYALQIGVALLYVNNPLIAQLLLSMIMFVPSLGAIFAKADLRFLGFRLPLKKNIIYILSAVLLPAILTAAGALLYFMIFPRHLDLSGSFVPQIVTQIESQGMTYEQYILINCIACITYAPLVNAIPALGEEIGWRGFLYPQLKKLYGHNKGLLYGGIIWGMWHWPLIALIGYEYGYGYVGFPITGMLLFCVYTTAAGIICDWLYEKSSSIWLPAIFHGAINASATIPLAVCIPQEGSYRLLGPAPIGIIAGLPFLILSIVLCLKQKDRTV